MRVIFMEDDKLKTSIGSSEEDDEASIDLDNKLYFPPEDTEIDISKNIRNMVFMEIKISFCSTIIIDKNFINILGRATTNEFV